MVYAALDPSIIVPIAIFGAFAAGAWWVIEWWTSRNTRASERLQELRDPRGRRGGQLTKATKSGFTMAKMLEKATPALSKPLTPKSEKDASAIKQRLSIAGFRHEQAPTIFYSLKLIGLVIGLIFGGGYVILQGNYTLNALITLFLFGAGGCYIPDLLVMLKGSQRKQAIFLGLPDALDLMVVCVESGLGLDQAMRKVAEEMKKSHRVIAEEFTICNFHLQMGKERRVVLQDLGQRNGVDDLRTLAGVLIQAEKFGSSVGQALRVQSDAMRTRRRQIAEEKAAKTAVQLIFPLVLFIFPGIFVVLVGPAAITMIREMFPAMGGG